MTPTDPPSSNIGRDSFEMERALREDLDRLRLDACLARQDASDVLARDIQASAPIDLGDIGTAIGRVEETGAQPFDELEKLLSSEEASVLRLEPNLLADLLQEGAEGQTILKRGCAFLKHRKYPAAVEWWSLNRRDLAPDTSKLFLLLLIMEALTHEWAGDEGRATAVRNKVYAHPLYRGGAQGRRP